MPFQRDPPHQRTVLRALTLFIALACFAFGLINLIRPVYLLAVVELISGIASLWAFFVLPGVKNIKRWAIVFVVFFSALLMLTLSSSATNPNMFVWIFLLPLVSYATLGARLGFRFTVVFGFVLISLFLYRFTIATDLINVAGALNICLCALVVWVFSHIYESSRQQSQKDLLRLVAEDPLTGLYNRVRLHEIFNREVSQAKRQNTDLSLLLLDLDHFKRVNDVFGHDSGDRVLEQLAELLRKNIRKTDYAFRVGGEEFCIILPGADRVKAEAVANLLRTTLEGKALDCNGRVAHITMSVGVCQWGAEFSSMGDVYAKADKRLYQAKHKGRNCVVAHDEGAIFDSMPAQKVS